MEVVGFIADILVIAFAVLFLLSIPFVVVLSYRAEKAEKEKREQEEKRQAADGRSYGILSNRVDELEEIAFQARREADRVGAELYVYKKEHAELHEKEKTAQAE